ncbi:MAG: ISNCY family transposase [Candidatus Peregrinibacteria bacterium]|nr:ISNCY family transposase [Candidatus Peregrinibacteria bacterium]
MRNRFEQQLEIGVLPIGETKISPKIKNALTQVLAGLLVLYNDKKHSAKICKLLEDSLLKNKKQTGRKGMTLWQIFVLAQVRLSENMTYERLHDMANNHLTLRSLLGVGADNGGFTLTHFEYQNIYDNVSKLSDELLKDINLVIVEFGHQKIFKKKETEALRLKSDSFVVESNVHFPTDYNLLFDCVVKSLSEISKIEEKHGIKGWRKLSDWKKEIKGLMRELGKTNSSGGKNKEKRVKTAATKYINKTQALSEKINKILPKLPIKTVSDLQNTIQLEGYLELMDKHIDLVYRRLIKGEDIPHQEKLFSIFEQYTEWVMKGKKRPSVELGKKLTITTDQFNLIIDYQIMNHQQDSSILIDLAIRILARYKVDIWSFDKGYWSKENQMMLEMEVPHVIMPKLGKRTKEEELIEKSTFFKKHKNLHSTIESNINELESRGLDRCPDRGFPRFKSYIGLGVCAYNIKKIGKVILDKEREELKKAKRGKALLVA